MAVNSQRGARWRTKPRGAEHHAPTTRGANPNRRDNPTEATARGQGPDESLAPTGARGPEDADLRLITGIQPVREALKAHASAIAEVWLLRDTPRLSGLQRLAESVGTAVKRVSQGDLDRAARGAQHQGALTWAPRLVLQQWADVLAGNATLAVALDRIVDPQNFGAIVRSAVALGRAPVLWPQAASAPLSPAMFRASAGAVEHATLCRVRSLPEALDSASAKGFTIVGLDGHASETLSDLDLSSPTVIVLGSEGEGLGRAVRKACTVTARLAQDSILDSLNASVAVAIALYEAQRQRRTKQSRAGDS
jgi:23S rRNA (guanosine2251-2'-O)-methyltransferase